MWMDVLDMTFTTIFTLEVIIKIGAYGLYTYSCKNPDFSWNTFDTLIVVLCIADEVLTRLAVKAGAGMLSILRILRLARIMRIVRSIRFVRDLRVMIAGIIASGKSSVWALLLLAVIQYLIAIILMVLVGEKTPNDLRDVDLDMMTKGLMHFIGYMFLSITGGIDWAEIVLPLFAITKLGAFLFALYVAFALFCVLNILTGVFVENATKLSARDEDNMIMDELEVREAWKKSFRQIFQPVMDEEDGLITEAAFIYTVDDENVQALFAKLGVDVTPDNAKGLFAMLDFDHKGVISMDEFQSGIWRMHGEAKSIDMAQVLVHNAKILHCLEELVSGIKNTSVSTVQSNDRQVKISHTADDKQTMKSATKKSVASSRPSETPSDRFSNLFSTSE
jgi:hypothetical protein